MRISFAILVVSLGLAGPGPLLAQDGPSPTLATAISGGSLLIGVGLIPVAAQFDLPTGAVLGAAAGVLTVFGPSFGFVYAGRTWRGVKSSLFRLGCIALMVGGAGLSFDQDSGAGAILIGAGLMAGVGSVVYDVWSVGDAAREERAVRLQAGLSPRDLGFAVRLVF